MSLTKLSVLAMALFVGLACGCSSSHRLIVSLRTDLVPGEELDGVSIRIGDRLPIDRVVRADRDWIEGGQLASIEGLSTGTHELTLDLLRGGDVFLQRPAVVEVSGTTALTITVTRDCRGVVCPIDDPASVACLGGRCVDPACSDESIDTCPSECSADADCMAESACALARCVSGTCLFEDDRSCAENEYCDPDEGCTTRRVAPTMDAGLDAGLDAALLDAGIDASPPCGLAPIGLSDTDAFVVPPAIAWTGDGYTVVWLELRDDGSPHLMFQRVDLSGRPFGVRRELHQEPIGVSSLTPLQVSIAWSGSTLGVAWQGYGATTSTAFFMVVDSEGATLRAAAPLDDNRSGDPDLRWIDDHFALAWVGGQLVYLQRFDAAGSSLGALTQISESESKARYPVLAWSGVGYGIVWHDFRTTGEFYLGLADPTGAKIGADIPLVASDRNLLAGFEWTGTRYVFAWSDETSGDRDIHGRIYDSLGAPEGADFNLASRLAPEADPYLRWLGGELLMGYVFSGIGRVVRFEPLGEEWIAPPSNLGNARTMLRVDASETTIAGVWSDVEVYPQVAMVAVLCR